MKRISAKFKSTCASTGETINRGDLCMYDPINRKVHKIEEDAATGQFIQDQEEAFYDNFCQNNNI